MILYNISKPMNTLRWCVWGGSIVGLLLCSIYLGDLFAIRGMSTKCIMLFVVFAIVTEPMMRYGTMIIEKIGKRITRRIEKKKKRKNVIKLKARILSYLMLAQYYFYV